MADIILGRWDHVPADVLSLVPLWALLVNRKPHPAFVAFRISRWFELDRVTYHLFCPGNFSLRFLKALGVISSARNILSVSTIGVHREPLGFFCAGQPMASRRWPTNLVMSSETVRTLSALDPFYPLPSCSIALALRTAAAGLTHIKGLPWPHQTILHRKLLPLPHSATLLRLHCDIECRTPSLGVGLPMCSPSGHKEPWTFASFAHHRHASKRLNSGNPALP